MKIQQINNTAIREAYFYKIKSIIKSYFGSLRIGEGEVQNNIQFDIQYCIQSALSYYSCGGSDQNWVQIDFNKSLLSDVKSLRRPRYKISYTQFLRNCAILFQILNSRFLPCQHLLHNSNFLVPIREISCTLPLHWNVSSMNSSASMHFQWRCWRNGAKKRWHQHFG